MGDVAGHTSAGMAVVCRTRKYLGSAHHYRSKRPAGACLVAAVRRGDLVVRYGGEEFCVLLPATPLAAATALAERIRNTTASTLPTALPFRVTVSIGLTTYSGGEHTVLSDLLARADEALYRAKDEGRDRVIALPLIERGTADQSTLPLENTI